MKDFLTLLSRAQRQKWEKGLKRLKKGLKREQWA